MGKTSKPRLKFYVDAEKFQMDTTVEFFMIKTETSLSFEIEKNTTQPHPASNYKMITFTTILPSEIYMERLYPELNLEEFISITFKDEFLVFENSLSKNNEEKIKVIFYHN